MKSVIVEGSYTHTLSIPDEWEFSELKNVIILVGGNQPPKSKFLYEEEEDTVRLIQIRDYKSDQHKVFIRKSDAKRFVEPTDVMVGRYGPPIFQILRGLKGAYNVALMKAEPILGSFDKDYLYYYLSNQDLYNYVNSASDRTAGQSGVNKEHLEKYPVPVVPLAEQQEIVCQLDIMLAQVEQIKARLDAIPAILKKFRQSVLADAVSGKLTDEWRYKNSNTDLSFELSQIKKDRENKVVGNQKRGLDFSVDENLKPDVELPKGWDLVGLGDLIEFLTDYHANGSYEKLRDHVTLLDQENYACMIRATNFEKNNFSDLLIYIDKEAYEFLTKTKLFGNEILISKIGNAGSVYLMPKLNRPCSLAMNLFMLRFNENFVNPRYINYFLTSIFGEKYISQYVRGVATKSIDKKSVRNVFVHYPCFDEQNQIVKIIDQLFEYADRVESIVQSAQKRVNLLTQSILAKAFSGELTAEWRKQHQDLITGANSAETLLARIQAEREASKPVKKTRKKKEA